VPFLLLTSVLAVSWAHFGFPEQQATSQTRPVNSQGVPLGGVVPAVCCSACVGCLRWIPAQKDAKTRFLAPRHPTVAATNNLMTDLYLTNEMSSFWPGLRAKKIRWKIPCRTLGGDSHFFHSGYWHLRNWLYMRPEAIFTPPERFFVNRTFSLTCRHRLFGHLMIAHHGYVLEIFTHHR
jgi:hypothetical protein